MVKLDRCHDALKRLHSGLDLVNDRHDLLAKMASIYADSLFQHDQALEYYQQCLSTQPENVYVRCNLVECLVITGKYAEGRAEADKLTGKLAPEDACGLSLVVLASYALEGRMEDRSRQFNSVLEHFKVCLSESAPRKQEPNWNFNGLINKVRASNIPAESKFLVLTAIDIQQGQLRNSALSFFAAAEREPQATCETPAALSSL
jgi:tetratricopeptide (TPR) repeat protein